MNKVALTAVKLASNRDSPVHPTAELNHYKTIPLLELILLRGTYLYPLGSQPFPNEGKIVAELDLSLNTLDCESQQSKCTAVGFEPQTARFEVQILCEELEHPERRLYRRPS